MSRAALTPEATAHAEAHGLDPEAVARVIGERAAANHLLERVDFAVIRPRETPGEDRPLSAVTVAFVRRKRARDEGGRMVEWYVWDAPRLTTSRAPA